MLEDLRYCPYYCEENAWHLAADGRIGARRAVALITNARGVVAVWSQRSAQAPDLPVLWDYHVVVFADAGAGWRAWDLDTTLGLDVDAAVYLDASFPIALPEYAPAFRWMDADAYRAALASDRRHMRTPEGGWQAPPPPWPTIGEGHTLDRLLDLDDAIAGEVLDLTGLRARLGP